MIAPAHDRRTSNGKSSLATWLTCAIHDYTRYIGREPKLIQIPYFRRDELAACVGPIYDFADPERKFRGIRLVFSNISDVIELHGAPKP